MAYRPPGASMEPTARPAPVESAHPLASQGSREIVSGHRLLPMALDVPTIASRYYTRVVPSEGASELPRTSPADSICVTHAA